MARFSSSGTLISGRVGRVEAVRGPAEQPPMQLASRKRATRRPGRRRREIITAHRTPGTSRGATVILRPSDCILSFPLDEVLSIELALERAPGGKKACRK